MEREVAGQSGAWFMRRIMPYRTRDEKTEGVVITFQDVTERRRTAEALTAAKRKAELAEHRQVALSRGREPRSAPTVADARAASGPAGEEGDGREGSRSWSAASTRRSAP